MNTIIDLIRQKMDKVINVVSDDLATVRVGVAKPSLVENVFVEAYGQKMRLMEVATISAPDTTQLMISPWDKGLLRAIEKAISESDLNLTPNATGDSIRIVIPPLTEERRQDYVKLVSQKTESGRVMVRQVRHEGREMIEKTKGQAGVSEDDIDRQLEELEKVTAEYITKVEQLAKEKEIELTRI